MTFRPILIALAIFGCIAIPLALAIWRLQSRKRPRHLRIPFSDQQALILQVKQLLSRFVSPKAQPLAKRFYSNLPVRKNYLG